MCAFHLTTQSMQSCNNWHTWCGFISHICHAMYLWCQQWRIQFTTVLSDCTYGAFATQTTGTHKLQVQAKAYVCSSVHSLPVRVDRQWNTSTQMLHYTAMPHYTAMFTTFLWRCLHPLLNACIDKYMLLHYQSTYSTSHVCHPVHSGYRRPQHSTPISPVTEHHCQ